MDLESELADLYKASSGKVGNLVPSSMRGLRGGDGAAAGVVATATAGDGSMVSSKEKGELITGQGPSGGVVGAAGGGGVSSQQAADFDIDELLQWSKAQL
jgi:hypothetical protein